MDVSKVGDKNPMWKRNDVSPRYMRSVIRKQKPKPLICESCHVKPAQELVSISQEYKRDVDDYLWLCRTCHCQHGRKKRSTKTITKTCEICGIVITGKIQKLRFCEQCGKSRIKERQREITQTPAYKAKMREESHSERAIVRRARHRASKQYKLTTARRNALDRCQDVESYITTYEKWLLKEERVCNNCGLPYQKGHALDHIIPLAYGKLAGFIGLDQEANLQVLCKQCHYAKSSTDLRSINRLKKRLLKLGITRVEEGVA